MPESFAPPRAAARPHTITQHGETRVDPYFWLREKSDPEVIAYLEAENRYAAEIMRPTEALQKQIYAEIVGRIQEDDADVPTPYGGFLYYTRFETGKQYRIHCRRRGSLDAPEQIILDQNELAAGHSYFRLGVCAVSPDHNLLAYSTDTEGDEVYTLFVRNLSTGELLPDRIPGTYYSLAWASDSRTFFYNVVDEAKRPFQVWRHSLDGSPDTLVYEEKDERFTLDVNRTRSGRFLLLESESHSMTEVRFFPADQPFAEPQVLVPRRPDLEYDADHHGDHFYLRINDHGRNFRLVRAPVSNPSAFEEILPHRPDVLLEHAAAFRDHLVLEERENGLPQLRVCDLSTRAHHVIAMPEPVYTVSGGWNPEFDTASLRFVYTSLTTPNSTFEYDVATRERRLLKEDPVLGGYDRTQYSTERLFATAPDGARIPIAVVYRNGFRKDGFAPLLLHGYGAYGLAYDADFRIPRLSLLDRGWAIAIANIRGGSELGKPWHDAGRMKNKPNSFTDFIAAAEHLIAARFTSTPRLAIEGRSAGGLLMGAVLNLRPDLFGACVAGVPFVDVLNTMSDATLPLTIGEYEEWGHPEDKAFYDVIKSYSPYDNLRPAAYPHLLVTAGLNDPRVSYWEPAKWVARLRTLKQDDRLLLLKTEMGAGHFGPSGRYEKFKDVAFDYAFLLLVMGHA